jgi:transposase-like protein
MACKILEPFKKNEERFGVPEIKGNLHFDEKYINVKGKHNYDLNVIDSISKFIFSEMLVEKRDLQKCKALLRRIKRWCYQQIMNIYRREKTKSITVRKLITFVADKFSNYHTAWKSILYRITDMTAGIPIAYKKHGVKHNNNPIERYNREIARRVNALVVFQSFIGAQALLSLRKMIHNYVTIHGSLNGVTPAEAAGIHLPLGQNKLLDLIRLAKKIEMTIK